ncbi:hypothetical protein HX561_026455, partial [Escherichia coli]|nr:hypothetical protein [Escherichia coli]
TRDYAPSAQEKNAEVRAAAQVNKGGGGDISAQQISGLAEVTERRRLAASVGKQDLYTVRK